MSFFNTAPDPPNLWVVSDADNTLGVVGHSSDSAWVNIHKNIKVSLQS